MYSQPELSAQGVKYIGITFPHMVQFKGKVRTLMMKTQQREDKLFILSMVLWGLVQVTCGRYILVRAKGYLGYNSLPLVVAPSLSFITAGKCTMAFAFIQGKVLKIAVFTFSFLQLQSLLWVHTCTCIHTCTSHPQTWT